MAAARVWRFSEPGTGWSVSSDLKIISRHLSRKCAPEPVVDAFEPFSPAGERRPELGYRSPEGGSGGVTLPRLSSERLLETESFLCMAEASPPLTIFESINFFQERIKFFASV
uniref:Uncharacterized protein n=1 Tax=Trichuris muris TaxID=70415 RepID=A0A5S6QV84_TRIMR